MDLKVYGRCTVDDNFGFVRTPNCPPREEGGVEYAIKKAQDYGKLRGPFVVVECTEIEGFVCIVP